MVNCSCFGVAGSNQRSGSQCFVDPYDACEYRCTDAANAVVVCEYGCTDAAHSVDEHGRTDATNALVIRR